MQRSDGQLVVASVAVAAAGLATGALSFVSFVDVRAVLKHLNAGKKDIVQAHFPVWWPCGRDFMVPLIAVNTLAHSAGWVLTKDISWLVSAACMGALAPYTKLVLGEDIKEMRSASAELADKTARRFCLLHHVRTGMAAVGFGVAISALVRACRGTA